MGVYKVSLATNGFYTQLFRSQFHFKLPWKIYSPNLQPMPQNMDQCQFSIKVNQFKFILVMLILYILVYSRNEMFNNDVQGNKIIRTNNNIVQISLYLSFSKNSYLFKFNEQLFTITLEFKSTPFFCFCLLQKLCIQHFFQLKMQVQVTA